MTKKQKKVVIATSTRPWSIVHGTIAKETPTEIVVSQARMIAYYDTTARTLYGVAKVGPGRGARVSGAVDIARIPRHVIEHILSCTDVASAAIEAEPWS